MFGKYSWSDFGLFVGCLLVVYYIVVVALYYRPHVLALLSGKKLAPAGLGPSAASAPRRSRAAAADDDLVTTTPYKSGAGTLVNEPPGATTETGAGAAENLTSGQSQIVAGTLPDSMAATGDNGAPTELATAETSGGAATSEAATLQEDEEEHAPIPLDEVSDETKKMLASALVIEKTTNEKNISEKVSTFVDTDADISYEAAANPQAHELEAFSVPMASTLNIEVEQASIINADELNSFLTELQDGPTDTVPEVIVGTTLGMAEAFMQHKGEVEDEIANMFSTAPGF